MKVAVLSLISRRAGGLFYSVRWLSKALSQVGCHLQVFSVQDRFTAEDVNEWEPLDVKFYTGYGPLRSSRKLRAMLRAAEPDIVHVHGIWLDRQWAALNWQRRTQKPVIISPRGMLDAWALSNAAWKKKLAGFLFANQSLSQASCIHALCRSEVEAIRAYGLTNPIALIPNGVEPPEDLSSDKMRNPAEKKQLLFLGRIHPKKGLAELLEAWGSESGQWREGWHLNIAGWDDGGHLEGLRALVRRMDMTDTVSFLGPQYGADKDALLRRASAFILPSFSEGLPMSVLEAWSYRLPVIMTKFCNLPEGFSEGAAIYVEPNPGSITMGLEKIVGMTEVEFEKMEANGRKLVEQKFSWPGIAADMQAVYEWCVHGGEIPSCVIE